MSARDEPLLIPAPNILRMKGGAPYRLERTVSYQGPLADVAFRHLLPACEKHGLRFVPGIPQSDGGAASVLQGDVKFAADSPAGGYSIHIDDTSVRMRADGDAGARHAIVTLAQLIRQFGPELPGVDIADHPNLTTRGLMLDISRNRVPTMSQLYALVDDLERLKLNHLQLYMEHTFAYVGHEEVWANASPMTPDEIKELDQYCRARGVELCACQNTLGHLKPFLDRPAYAQLREIDDDDQAWSFFAPDGREIKKSGPFSLCPTEPRSIEFVRDLLDQLLPCFSSERVNIGCDEAFDVGQGRSRDAVKERGYEAVFAEHLKAVDEIVKSHGKRSLFWGDMLANRQNPRVPLAMPDDMTPLVWGYEAETEFVRRSAPTLIELPRPWFCPGTSSWLSIVGRSSNRRRNLSRTLEYGPIHKGFLICDWGDRGHRQHWPISLIAIANAAHVAWNDDPDRPFDPHAASLQLFDDESLKLGPWLEELGDVDSDLNDRLELKNAGALYTEMHRPLADVPTDPEKHGSLQAWESIRDRLSELRSQFDSFDDSVSTPLVRAELEHTLRQAEHAADKAIVSRGVPDRVPRGPARIRLAADMGSILEDYRELWHSRARPGGLEESAAWFERVIDDYQHPE